MFRLVCLRLPSTSSFGESTFIFFFRSPRGQRVAGTDPSSSLRMCGFLDHVRGGAQCCGPDSHCSAEMVLMWSYDRVCSPRGPRRCSPVCAAGLMQKDHCSVENLFSVVPLIKGFYSEGAFKYQVLLTLIFPSSCYLIWSCSKFSGPTHL